MKRGWCPGLYAPMQSADGLLIRLRPPGGWLDGARLEVLAEAAARFGNGRIELTAQGRLQVRGLMPRVLPDFAAAMVQAGLAAADPAVEARRRVTCLPGGDAAAAAAIEAALVAASGPLAAKFDVVVGNDAQPPADIMLQGGLLWLAGASRAAGCADPVDAVLRLITALDGLRMRDRVAACGEAAVYRLGGLVADSPIPGATRAGDGGFEAGLPFGVTTPVILRTLARLATRFGDGRWHVTRGRALWLGGVRAPAGLASAAAAAGLIVEPEDVRRRVSACPGRAGCASALVDARDDAMALLRSLPEIGELHVSGCSKGCAHPAPAAFTLVGTADGYNLVRNGRAGDVPAWRGLSLEAARMQLEAVWA